MPQNIKNQDREGRFKRVAAKRADRVLDTLRILGNCSNKSAYKYSEEDVNKIFRAIEEQLRITKARFQSQRRKKFIL